MAHRLRRHKAINEQCRISKIFSSTPGSAYRQLAEKPRTDAVPDTGQCAQFWKEIMSNEKRNNEVEWMAHQRNFTEQCLTEITKTEEQEKINKMSTWKAQGPDKVQVFWIKHLTVLHDRICIQL